MIKSAIIFDVETTGLLAAAAAGQEKQPYIIEFAAIKIDHNLEVIDTLRIFMKPPVKIGEDAAKVTGITNEELNDCKPFIVHWKQIAYFFLGTDLLIAHNIMFDKTVLYWELARLNKHLSFPWPINSICTLETTEKWLGHRLSLTDLYMKLFEEQFSGAHGARSDTIAVYDCMKKFVEMGILKIF